MNDHQDPDWLDEILRKYIHLDDYINLSSHLDDDIEVKRARETMESDIAEAKALIESHIKAIRTNDVHEIFGYPKKGEIGYTAKKSRLAQLLDRKKGE